MPAKKRLQLRRRTPTSPVKRQHVHRHRPYVSRAQQHSDNPLLQPRPEAVATRLAAVNVPRSRHREKIVTSTEESTNENIPPQHHRTGACTFADVLPSPRQAKHTHNIHRHLCGSEPVLSVHIAQQIAGAVHSYRIRHGGGAKRCSYATGSQPDVETPAQKSVSGRRSVNRSSDREGA